MKKVKYFLIVILLCFGLMGCSSGGDNGTIGYVKAKELIINNQATLVDVRTVDEYNENHIEGAVNLPVDEIDNNLDSVINNKDSYIIVYCKSGVRSHEAYEKLVGLGYKNVYDLGSIDNWK